MSRLKKLVTPMKNLSDYGSFSVSFLQLGQASGMYYISNSLHFHSIENASKTNIDYLETSFLCSITRLS